MLFKSGKYIIFGTSFCFLDDKRSICTYQQKAPATIKFSDYLRAMENFVHYNPTKIIFGREVADQLPQEIFWKKALVVIGQSSAKKSGLYARIVSLLNMAGLEHITFEGIKASASYQDADLAIKMAQNYGAEVVIAIGGCSVIDTAKAIALGFYTDHSVWDFFMNKKPAPDKVLPNLNLLTVASTGSAMNDHSVLCDPETGIKREFCSPLLYPRTAFLDPHYSTTVSAAQTALGIATVNAYAMQQFLNDGDAVFTDYITTDLMRLNIQYGKEVMQDLKNYQLRAQLMWLATVALNDTLSAGKNDKDKSISNIAYNLDLVLQTSHGISITIVLCAWLKLHQYRFLSRIRFLAKHVFASENFNYDATAEGLIKKLDDFYACLSIPTKISDCDISISKKQPLLDSIRRNKITVGNYKMDDQDYEQLVEMMW